MIAEGDFITQIIWFSPLNDGDNFTTKRLLIMYAQIIQFTKMLYTLFRLLDKAQRHAEANKSESAVLLNSCLSPDMLPC